MSMLSESKPYRSPRHKLLAFFEKSRDRWKAIARQQRDEVERLRQELERTKNSLP